MEAQVQAILVFCRRLDHEPVALVDHVVINSKLVEHHGGVAAVPSRANNEYLCHLIQCPARGCAVNYSMFVCGPLLCNGRAENRRVKHQYVAGFTINDEVDSRGDRLCGAATTRARLSRCIEQTLHRCFQ
jgi:hypothetical protein